MMMMSGRRNRFPFTATQWQELQHQALIFKYIVSGIPIPPHLLFSFDIKSTNLQHIGWNCYMGRKVDPEPGRCRRTDGKKWRCSKQAYTDSKYCERHMHRGKNRSRKPVEQPSTMVANPSTATDQSLSLSLSSSHGLGIGLSLEEKTTHEHDFFSETSGTTRSFSGSSMDDESWQLMPLTMSSSSSKQMNLFQLHSSKQNKHDDEPCCVLGSETKRTVHKFFDEWPLPKHRDSSSPWLVLDDNSSNSSSSASPVNQALSLFSSS